MLEHHKLKSDGWYGLMREPYEQYQHSNQPNGFNLYVDVLDFSTHKVNRVKLYKSGKGLYFRTYGNHYLSDFKQTVIYVPFQIIKVDEDV